MKSHLTEEISLTFSIRNYVYIFLIELKGEISTHHILSQNNYEIKKYQFFLMMASWLMSQIKIENNN